MKASRKGFTLIELLVVIAIIAILAAILFPILVTAKQKAHSINCCSNLKQLSSALQMYLDSWNEAYPSMHYDISTANYDDNGQLYSGLTEVGRGQENYVRRYCMMGVIGPYTKNTNVWKCPSDAGCTPAIVRGKRWSSYPYRFFIAFATHPWILPWYKQDFGVPPFKTSSFPQPTRTFVFNEQITFHDDKGILHVDSSENIALQMNGKARMNFVFMDGHVKTYPLELAVRYTHEGIYDYAWPDPIWDGRFIEIK